MKTIEITAQLRKETGKKDTKKLRKENNVPCVMYGGEKNVHFYSHENNFKDLIYTPNVYIVNIKINGDNYRAALKEIQFHPVTDKLSHIDFVQVFDDKPVIMKIPIQLIGESVGLKGGGKLRQKRRELTVKGLASVLPNTIDVDITDLDIGSTIKIHELNIEGIEILDSQRSMIVAVISSRLAMKGMEITEPEVEAEEGEEGEEATTDEEESGEESNDSSEK